MSVVFKMSRVYLVDTSFVIDTINHFSKNKIFGSKWIIVKLTSDNKNKFIAGKCDSGTFCISISKCFKNWEYHIMDCLSYQEKYNRNVILSIDKDDYERARTAYQNHCITDRELRAYEPRVLVHSTTLELWHSIEECGYLKSWNTAKKDGNITENEPIGYKLGDPKDFSDYIMFGGMGFWNEVVVLSKQKNKLCYDKNETYTPGARLYFDAQRIAEDGHLVRDGMHLLKVKDRLPLEPYIIWIATSNICKTNEGKWTPLTFSEVADNTFFELFSQYRG